MSPPASQPASIAFPSHPRHEKTNAVSDCACITFRCALHANKLTIQFFRFLARDSTHTFKLYRVPHSTKRARSDEQTEIDWVCVFASNAVNASIASVCSPFQRFPRCLLMDSSWFYGHSQTNVTGVRSERQVHTHTQAPRKCIV